MSLINQMLQDLEKRQGEPESGGQLPAGVHSAPQEVPAQRKPWIYLGALAALGVAGGVYWTQFRPQPPVAPSVPVASVPAEAALPPVKLEVEAPAQPVQVSAATEQAPVPTPEVKPTARLVPSERQGAKSKQAALKSKKAALAAANEARKKQQLAAKPGTKVLAVKSMPVDEAQERAEASYREALSAFNLGRGAETQQAARKALAEYPAHIGARQLLVRHLMEQRANDQARAELRDGLQHQPSQMLWSTMLVRLELEKNDVNAARQAVDRAMPYAAQQADFQSLAGAVAQRQGKPADAADFYRNALRIKPGDGRSWVGLGMSLEAEGHAPEAKEAFRRALSTESLNPELQALAERKSR